MDAKELKSKAKARAKVHKALFNELITRKGKEVDMLFHEAHYEEFSCRDCLQCGNCCKTTGPLFTSKDVERIAKHLKIKPGDFVESYLKEDEDGDLILQSTPCAFLSEDNYCSIYEARPKACAEYPHTNRRDQMEIKNLTLKNAQVCPAVFNILEAINQGIFS